MTLVEDALTRTFHSYDGGEYTYEEYTYEDWQTPSFESDSGDYTDGEYLQQKLVDIAQSSDETTVEIWKKIV